jgi:hypothetical protein
VLGLPSREEIKKGTAVEKGELIRRLEEYLEMARGVEAEGGDVDTKMWGVQE